MSPMRRRTDPSPDSGRHGAATGPGCSSFHRIKLIQIVHLLLHLRHLNVSANKHSCMTLHAVCCELTFEPTVTNVTMFFTIPNCLSAFVIKILL